MFLISSSVKEGYQEYLYLIGRASLIAQLVKNLPVMQEIQVHFLGWEDPLGRKWQPAPVFLTGGSGGQRTLAGCSPRGRKSRTLISD